MSAKSPSAESLIPAALLFHATFPVPRIDALPGKKAPSLTLPESCRLALPAAMDKPPFAEYRAAWNSQGLAVEVIVSGKSHVPRCDPRFVEASDSVLLTVDTRDTRTIHRASRFCHSLTFMPLGGGTQGKEPWFRQNSLMLARENAPKIDSNSVTLESAVSSKGYRLGIWLSKAALHGFDPESQRRLGFSVVVKDTELGEQALTVGRGFQIEVDPSLWSSLELMDD